MKGGSYRTGLSDWFNDELLGYYFKGFYEDRVKNFPEI